MCDGNKKDEELDDDPFHLIPQVHRYILQYILEQIRTYGWAQWLMHFGRPRWADHGSGDGDHPGQHGETWSLLKIQKLAEGGSMCL